MTIQSYPKMLRALVAVFVSILTGIPALHAADPAAFPGAEGFGAVATGGRGGTVYIVTNLNDSGTGSFRDAVSQPNRTVVFAVGGVINIASDVVVSGSVTIAGQTAPGDGITVYGSQVGFRSNVICRYMRFHGSINMDNSDYTLSAAGVAKGIFDHTSVLWGRWDNMKLDGSSTDVTFQYCLVGEAILPQNLGALFETAKNVTVHHTLWIDNKSRNPKAKSFIQYFNNVVYSWGSDGLVGGHSSGHFYQDVIANYFIAGPISGSGFMSQFGSTDHVFHRDNFIDLNKDGTLNGRLALDADIRGASLSTTPYFGTVANPAPVFPVTIDTAAAALQKVIAKAGASNRRDPVDTRLITQLTSYGTLGALIQRESDVGGQPPMAGGIPPKDTNNTGIPDWWAEAMGNAGPANTAWSKTVRADGYTNLEFYINSIVTSGLPDAVISGITPASGVIVTDPVTRGSITNAPSITLNGTAPANATVQISSVDGSVPAHTVTANASGNWTSSSIALGTPRYYAFTVRVDRGSGAYSLSSAAYAVHVKTSAPAAPVINRFVVGATQKTFSGTAEPYSTVTVYVTGGTLTNEAAATAAADGYGNWEAVCNSAIVFAAVSHDFTATATDLVGNISGPSATLTLDMGIVPPVFTKITTDSGSSDMDHITTDQTLVLFGTAPASAPVTVYRLGTTTPIGTTTADASGDWSVDYTATTLPEGKHTFLANAGGATPSAMSAPFFVTIDRTAPTIASIRRYTPSTTNTSAATLTYRVAFAEPVIGTLAASNFALTTASGVTGSIGTITRIDTSTFEVNVTGAGGDGTIRLDLKANANTIEDLAGNKCTAAYTGGQTYVMRYVGSGVWDTDQDAAWSDTNSWDGGLIASGIGATADFGTVDIAEETTVTLDAPVTLGRMIFADADEESGGNWLVASGASNASITLANPGSTMPEIKVVYETLPDDGAQNYDKSRTGANVPVTINAKVSSTAGLYKTGWGTVILNNTGAFSGPINVEQGRVHFGEGTLVNLSSGQALTIGTTSGGGGQLIINGGTFSTVNNTTIPYATLNVLELRKGRADFRNISTTGDGGGLIKVSGGIFTAGDINIGRTAGSTGDFSHGFIVSGGTATVANLGIATNNSYACLSVEGGRLDVTGALTIAWLAGSTRGAQARVQGGGQLFANDIILSRASGNTATLDITNGTVTANRLLLGYDASVSAGSATLTLNGASAALYLGASGLVKNGSLTTTVNLTNGTLGADNDWSTTMPMRVTETGEIIIKAASAAGVAHDITLAGVLSNSGTLAAGTIIKTGGGKLTLSAVNTHTGPINVNAGVLNVTGRIATSTETVSVNTGASLVGSGTISRPVVLKGGGLIAGAAPLNVVSLTKQSAGVVPVTFAPASPTGSSRVRVATFGSTNLVNADFATLVDNGVLYYMDVSGTSLDQVAYNLAAANENTGITGGGNAAVATVADAAAFKAAIESTGAGVVVVSGAIDLTSVGGSVKVASNKTILGQNEASTIAGSVAISGSTSNVVINGVNITNAAGNGLVIDGAKNVYVTHCTFFDCNGPLVSAINGADNITISWSEFYYTAGFAGKRTAMQIGKPGAETKPLKVVLHHNYWSDRCADGMPVSDFGYIHMYNNYLFASSNTTATVVGELSQMLSARNKYQSMVDPIAKAATGLLAVMDNNYTTTTGSIAPGLDKVFVPAYSHVLETITVTGSNVPKYAGNTGGSASFTPALIGGTAFILNPGIPVPNGGTFMLAADVQGAAPTSYQWNLNNFPISSATNMNYTVTNAKAITHSGAYSVSVGVSTGETIVSGSSNVSVGANNLPVIVNQPVAQNVRLGDRAVFAVTVTSDTPVRYQWQNSGVMIPFANDPVYYVDASRAVHLGNYRVVVTNDAGTVTSDYATLTISDIPAPSGGDSGGGGGAPSWWLLGAAALLVGVRAARKIRGAACAIAILFTGLFAATDTQAADGTWSNASSGNWADAGSWAGGNVASGAGSTATFTNAGDKTVTVNSAVTVGNMTFGGGNWALASSGVSGVLTLEVATFDETTTPITNPVIDVGTTTVTINGHLGGIQGFTKIGTGLLILSGSNTVNGHVLISATSGTMSVGAGGYLNLGAGNLRVTGGASAYFTVDGGTFITTGIVIAGGQAQAVGEEIAAPYPRAGGSALNTNMTRMVLNSGYAKIGEFRTASDSRGTLLVTGGTLVTNYINIRRSGANVTDYAYGFVSQGGYVEAANIGIGTNNSYSTMSVEGGTVLVTGTFVVGWNDSNNGRGASLRVNNGRLTSTSAEGLVLTKATTASTTGQSPSSLLAVSGGVTTLEKITFGQGATATTNTSSVTLSGGALYLGSGGIVKGESTLTTTITLSGGTLGAKGTWSSTLPIAISAAATISTASEANAPFNITLDGIVSGAGTITKTGAGTLKLTAANTHTGAITVTSGTLEVTNGVGASTNEIIINTGATLKAAGASMERPVVFNGGVLALGNTPMVVTSLAKRIGSGNVQITFTGTFSDKLTIATFDSTDLDSTDFDPVTVSGGTQVFVKVSANKLELVTSLFTPPNVPAGITGGDGGLAVFAATAADLKTALELPTPATVYVSGLLDLTASGGVVNVGPNKTIVGQNALSTISGQLNFTATSGNVIILGVNFTNAAGNGLVLDGAKNVYITHCTFFDCNGALVSAINGADNITISWSEFYYSAGFAGQRSAMVIGKAGTETNPLHLVLHHNYWSDGCVANMPVSNNGHIHMYDNYLHAASNTSATIVSANSQMLSEGNVYQDMAAPIQKNSGGLLRVINNIYVNTTGTAQDGKDVVFAPDYSRVLETGPTIGAIVPQYAGNYAGINSVPPDAAVSEAVVIMASGTTVPTGGGFTLIASMPGYQPQSYQWYLNNLPVAGATNSAYAVINATAIQSGPYSVGATLSSGETVISAATRVTVGAGHAPVIKVQPASIVVAAQNTAVFGVVATGDELKYQWQKNGANIAGATSAILSLAQAQDSDAASYRVIVTNDYGMVTSDAATLTLRAGAGDNGGDGGGGGGAPSWWLLGAVVVLMFLRTMATRRSQTR